MTSEPINEVIAVLTEILKDKTVNTHERLIAASQLTYIFQTQKKQDL